jgi:hypothetical protein
VRHLPQHACDEAAAAALRQGRAVEARPGEAVAEGQRVACVAEAGALVGIAEFRTATGRLHPRVVLPAP